MTATTQEFDGWTNVQTHHANLLLKNSGESYFWLQRVSRCCGGTAGTLSYYMRGYFMANQWLWQQDINTEDLPKINWDEIAENWLAS